MSNSQRRIEINQNSYFTPPNGDCLWFAQLASNISTASTLLILLILRNYLISNNV